ncbi:MULTISPECIES: chromate efflux transporter [Sphingomonas]|uniref:Chromate transporter n=2 Tax=Sphingomonas TaxID=13687 RepID=A0A916TGB4_9SPHN|nr:MULTISPECIES: chromate efflux transporter [Sphingomonas]MAX01318.1 chromate transporter [Sphingomonas sp.]PAX08934.1 chromate transporter [Sphingomonas lenta]GGB42596.1 chromate transporter [Sphingomonas metalli]
MNASRKAELIGTPGEVFGAFLKLGITSFGGPIAHLGYFRDELVIRRRWVNEPAYAELVALCQFLPGPASSQVGFSLGLARAGPLGALAAWVAFTLPSTVLMLVLALVSAQVDGPVAGAVFHALKLVAVVIVAQAVWGMARSLTPDLRRVLIAVAAGLITGVMGGALGQVAAILLGAGAGVVACRHLPIAPGDWAPITVRRRVGAMCLIFFALLLVMLPPIAGALGWRELRLFDLFYRAGALVFGGGHVVLPLLHATLVPIGWIDDGRFLAGYGAAQALPGPLFTISAYLGAFAGKGVGGAVVALVGIFLPGFLILVGVLPFWTALRRNALVRAAIAGVNAAVVGILALALYDPLWTSSVRSWRDTLLVVVALIALLRWRLPPLAIVTGMVGGALGLLAL